MFVINGIAKFILAIEAITAAMVILRATAIGTAIATAFATGGVSVGTAVAALAGIGATALVTSNHFDIMNGKETKKGSKGVSPRGNANNRDFSVVPYKTPLVVALDKNTKATIKNTKSIMEIATQNAMAELAKRQKALSGGSSIAIGGGSKIYGTRNDQGAVNVTVNAGNVVGSADALIEVVKNGLVNSRKRNGNGRGALAPEMLLP
jgi:dihydrofolate reductase